MAKSQEPALTDRDYGELLLSRLAVKQGNQLLACGRRLNPGAGHDLARAHRLSVQALVSVAVGVKRGAVE